MASALRLCMLAALAHVGMPEVGVLPAVPVMYASVAVGGTATTPAGTSIATVRYSARQ